MEVLAIIPARGGSKGIPRKNLMPLCGKPLLAWSIEAAKFASKVDRVVVSTDDVEIALVSRQLGAEVVMRSAEASGDLSSSEQALIECLNKLETGEGYQPDIVVMLQCTSPLTTAADIDGVLETMQREQADAALAASSFHHFLWRSTNAGATAVGHDSSRRLMRQQQTPQYLECGSVYAMRANGLRESKHRFFGKTVLHPTSPEHTWEIDEPIDMEVAEVLLRRQLAQQSHHSLPRRIDAVVFDFDGVMTDNRVYVSQEGIESVVCSRGDGMGISLLRRAGVPMLVLSSETNPVVLARCQKLQLPAIGGAGDKLPLLKDWLRRNQARIEHTVYVGNDVNDLDCLHHVGCGVAVADAAPEAKRAADIVLSNRGGQGAVRELCDLLLQRIGEANYAKVA